MAETNNTLLSPFDAEEAFHAIAVVMNRFILISEKQCDLSPAQMLILWHTARLGKINSRGYPCILQQELTRILKARFGYDPSRISKWLTELRNKGLIEQPRLTSQERTDLFGPTGGNTLVVILTAKGRRTLKQFKNVILGRTEKWLAKQSTPEGTALANLFFQAMQKVGEHLTKQYGRS